MKPEIVTRYEKAKKALQKAKVAETSNISENQLFDLYQDAYEQFERLSRRVQEAEEAAAFLQHKATKKDVVSNFSLWTGIAGFAVGIIGIIINFL